MGLNEWLQNLNTRNPGLLFGLGQVGSHLSANATTQGLGGLSGGLANLPAYIAAAREHERKQREDEEEEKRRREEHELRMEQLRQKMENDQKRVEMDDAQAKISEGERKTQNAAMLGELARLDPGAARSARHQPPQAALEALRAARGKRDTAGKLSLAKEEDELERARRRREEQVERRRRLSSIYQGRLQLAEELGLPPPQYTEETFVALEGKIPTAAASDRGKQLRTLATEQDILTQRIKGLREKLGASELEGGVIGNPALTEQVVKQIAALEEREAKLVAAAASPAAEPPPAAGGAVQGREIRLEMERTLGTEEVARIRAELAADPEKAGRFETLLKRGMSWSKALHELGLLNLFALNP